MSKVNLIATAYQCYGGAWFKSGEPFVADNESDASELCCIGFAMLPPATGFAMLPPATGFAMLPPATGYATRAMEAIETSAARAAPDVVKKRPYNRRDLVAAK